MFSHLLKYKQFYVNLVMFIIKLADSFVVDFIFCLFAFSGYAWFLFLQERIK